MSAPMSTPTEPATVDACLRLGAGFGQRDRGWIVAEFSAIDSRLAAFPADSTELELSVKDREVRGQKVTLECWIAGWPKIVTTSTEEDLRAALHDVRDDLRRRLNDTKTRQEPRSNRHLRDTGPDLLDPDLVDSDRLDPAAAADRVD